ncbi:MAG: hypothetical protein H6810_13240 [Phycisphaeraceae bacterium]|nr:MAG: hypothetical protein H6810_13240 [Phycisphaeraceae bacterium]
MQYQRFNTVGLFIVAGSLAIGGFAKVCPGQDEATPEGPNTGALHFELGAEWTSAYYFRGLLQENDGFILQSWLDVGVDLTKGDNWALTANLGIWNSTHGDADTAGTTDDFVKHLYETDLYAGLGLDLDAWSLGVSYVAYTSPSDAFSTIHEIDLSAGYDDSSLWDGKFALNPSLTLAIEVDDTGGTEDTYLELGIAPGFSREIGGTTVEFTFPVTVGFGVDDYYIDSTGNDDFFGYVDAGVDASIPLGLPTRFGTWSLNGGVHVLVLGDAASDLNSGDDFEVVGRLGLSISY